MSTWICGHRPSNWSADERIDANDARSSVSGCTSCLPVRVLTSATAASTLAGVRLDTTTVAPAPANATAVSRPIPDVPPVMTMTLPDWSGSALGFTPGAYSRPAELIEPVVIDAEVMRYLVYDGDPHLVRDLLGRRATTQDRQAVDRDPVRQHAGVRRRTSVRQRHTVIEPEQVR